MQLAITLHLVQLEPSAERNGMPVPRCALEGVGHHRRTPMTAVGPPFTPAVRVVQVSYFPVLKSWIQSP